MNKFNIPNPNNNSEWNILIKKYKIKDPIPTRFPDVFSITLPKNWNVNYQKNELKSEIEGQLKGTIYKNDEMIASFYYINELHVIPNVCGIGIKIHYNFVKKK